MTKTIPKIHCPLCRTVSMYESGESDDKLLCCDICGQEIVWLGDYP